VLQRFGDMGMTAVGIGGIEEAQAVIVSVKQEIGETLNSQSRLVRMMSGADCACPDSETAGLDAGAAQRDRVGGGKFLA
jgi:hypothetical protein